MIWLLVILSFVVGLGLLVWASGRFINSSVALAQYLQIPPLIIGIVFIGFGTSIPEMVVGAIAALNGAPAVAVGNAIGSNIANVGLVLGIGALISPLHLSVFVWKRELPLSWLIALLVGVLLMNNFLGRVDAFIMLGLLIGYLLLMVFVFARHKDYRATVLADVESEVEIQEKSLMPISFWWLFSLLIIFLASDMLVQSAVTIARYLKVSEMVIGLSIVALGTSLPELATVVTSSIKGQVDLVLGNIIGSNVFNLLAVLAMPGFIQPFALEQNVLRIDYPVMFGFMLAPGLLAWRLRRPAILGRISGGILVVAYLSYIAMLYV